MYQYDFEKSRERKNNFIFEVCEEFLIERLTDIILVKYTNFSMHFDKDFLYFLFHAFIFKLRIVRTFSKHRYSKIAKEMLISLGFLIGQCNIRLFEKP